MAEKNTAAKSKVRTGCNLRKPLRDVSNRKKQSASNKIALKQHQIQNQTADDEDDYSLDRLLLVQSEISSLLHQIDGLVVQAFKLESMGEAEKIQIKAFNRFLAGTLESFKPWVPRFEKVLATACKASRDSRSQEICDTGDADGEDENDVIKSPEVIKTKSLVSPSPLVSWRDSCTVQKGKRLFLLTPLPKTTVKSVMSKQHNPIKSSFGKFSSSAVQAIPRFGLTEITCGDLLKRQHEALLMEEKCNIMRTPGCNLDSTPKFSFGDGSMLVMTPGYKMSPPRSCVLLEPVIETGRCDTDKPHKSTPYPGQLRHASEMSSYSSQFNEELVFKCPQLVGMNSGVNVEADNKEADVSLSWVMSPPKTCVLMEPSYLKTTAVLPSIEAESDVFSRVYPNKSENVKVECSYTVPKSSFQEITSNLPEGTPMWKSFGSTVRSGRRPGENTLKKELWTKFEAASSNDISFYASRSENDCHIGFLDRLEEVSGDETTFPLKNRN